MSFNDDPFDTPSSGDRIQDLEGLLLLITPIEYLEGVSTSFGDTDAVDADVVALDAVGVDGVEGPQEYAGMRVFPGALVGALKRAAKFNEANPGGDPRTGKPKMILGRLGKGEAKKGQSAPWIFTVPDDADKKLAREYLAKQPKQDDDPFAV